MAFKDLREWIDRLEKDEELKRVKAEVDWNREIGNITRKVFDKNGPALLFENIKDYKTTRCRKIYVGGLASKRRVALMLGLSKATPEKTLIEITRKRFKERIKPILVGNGPVKENIVTGDEVDLYQFPVPFLHPQDGGRFFNTSCAVITEDPDTRVINVGTYRGMLVDKDKISVVIHPGLHWGQHFLKYKSMRIPMPVSIAYSWDPAMKYVAQTGIPPSVSEFDVMGAIRGEPVSLIKSETNDLLVPAWAEIVVEGKVSLDPSTYREEGPFGEYTGYYGGERILRPVLKVECITHRNDPIYTTALEGWGPGHPNETGVMAQITTSAMAWNILEQAGLPGIKDVYLLPGSCVNNVAVQIHKTYKGQAKQVALALWGSGMPVWLCKNVIVVDDDIDIHDFEALEWAIAYRVNPKEDDIVVVPGLPAAAIDPSIPFEERSNPLLGVKTHKLLIDATKNWDYPAQEQYGGEIYPPVCFLLEPEDEKVLEARWKEYGFDF